MITMYLLHGNNPEVVSVHVHWVVVVHVLSFVYKHHFYDLSKLDLDSVRAFTQLFFAILFFERIMITKAIL